MIRRALLGLFALCFASAAFGQTYQPGRAPNFRPGFQFLSAAAPPVVATTTWNPADKSPNVTLSNGNLRGASNSNGGIARGTLAAPSGNRHLELTFIAAPGAGGAGLYPSNTPLDGTGSASTANVFYVSNGNLYFNGSPTAVTSFSTGATIGIDYNKDTGAVSVSLNGTTQLTGNIGSGLTTFPGFGFGASQTWDLNCGQSPFVSNPNNVPAWG